MTIFMTVLLTLLAVIPLIFWLEHRIARMRREIERLRARLCDVIAEREGSRQEVRRLDGVSHYLAKQIDEARRDQLLNHLRENNPDFAADLDRGHDVITMFDGHYTSWAGVIAACRRAGAGGDYAQCPTELIFRLADQRDEAREKGGKQ